MLGRIETVHGKTSVSIEYKAEQATRYLLATAVELVEAIVRSESFPLEDRIREAKAIAAETELGPSTRSIVEAAERRGLRAGGRFVAAACATNSLLPALHRGGP